MTPEGDLNDVAVIGIGLRFPGNANNPEELWGVLERKESQWSEFPESRLNIDGYYHPSGERQGSISFRGAHFLSGDIAAFDAPFFSVPAEDAKAIDPQQRLLLEVCYEAVENAGFKKEDLDGSNTAVYVGSFVKDYEQICLRDPDWQPQYAATGNGIAIMANRISYFFNLHGPSVTVDTGCSGSLVSVHLAAQTIRSGESSLAIAAGAGLILTPNTIMPMTALNFLSPGGKCFTFDARANGYGRGEGVGVVVLKRLSDALRDNDTIRSVIRGSRVNQDGRTTGITLPSKEAQVANIRDVYASARLDFNQTAYVECHGTGTQAGDWRELKAISETLASDRPLDNPLVVGSIKTNIGHLEGSAGVAGLIKAVLMLERGLIPPNINFERGNPSIDFAAWKIKVPTAMEQWPLRGVRRVSVNCFGFGGTNAHVILDAASSYMPTAGFKFDYHQLSSAKVPGLSKNSSHTGQAQGWDVIRPRSSMPRLLCYSAHDMEGVDRILQAHMRYLDTNKQVFSEDFMLDYAYTLGCRRSNMEWRRAIIADSVPELIEKIFSEPHVPARRARKSKAPNVCFIFCGQGAQWAQMGQALLIFPPFRNSLQQAACYLKLVLNSPFDLLDELFRPSAESRLTDPVISQPATTALQVALVDLLFSFGVHPSHVIGHSSGEIAAAFASGAVTRQAAWEIAYFRGIAASRVPLTAPKFHGGMMMVGMSQKEAQTYLESRGVPLQLACINSPRSITLSGESELLQLIAEDLRERKQFFRILNVQAAYHSTHMRRVGAEYQESLKYIRPRNIAESTRMFSTVSGKQICGTDLHSAYWTLNLTSPVRYLHAVQAMMGLPPEKRPSVILELSPSAALGTSTSDTISNMDVSSPPDYYSVIDRQSDSVSPLMTVLGELWTKGCQLDMDQIFLGGTDMRAPRCLVSLPPYPWNHEKSYWHESHLNKATRFRKYPRQDLIGAPTADSVSFEPRWRGFLRISESPWIQDHQVQKSVVYPAAGMICMVLEGAKQMADEAESLLGYELANVKIEKAMLVPSTCHGLEVALNIRRIPELGEQRPELLGCHEFAVYSKPLDKPWERHVHGELNFRYKEGNWRAMFQACEQRLLELGRVCKDEIAPRQLYELLDAVGMNYGPLFQNINTIYKDNNGSCVSTITVPSTKSRMPGNFEYPHLVHPATLDSMFQTLFAIDLRPMVPTFIRRIFVSESVGAADQREFTGCATATRFSARNAEASISMRRTGLGDCYVVIDGLCLTAISTDHSSGSQYLPNHRSLCTEIVWKQDICLSRPPTWAKQVALLAHKFPGLSILQVGGGSDIIKTILAGVLPQADGAVPRLSRYTVLDESEELARRMCAGVVGRSLQPFFENKALDALVGLGEYHLVVFEEGKASFERLKKNMKPAAIVLEYKKGSARINGAKGDNTDRNASDKLDEPLARKLASFQSGEKQEQDGEGHDRSATLRVHHRPMKGKFNSNLGSRIVVLASEAENSETLSFIDGMRGVLQNHYTGIFISSMAAQDVLVNSSPLADSVVISLLDLAESSAYSVYHWTEQGFNTFHILQKVARGILCITRGAHMQPTNPRGAPIVALARTLMSEDPLKSIITLDLAEESQISDTAVHQTVFTVLNSSFAFDLSSGPRETEYAERGGELFIPRLQPVWQLNNMIEDDTCGGILCGLGDQPNDTDAAPMGRNIIVSKPGQIKDSLSFRDFKRALLGPSDVEIAFKEVPLTNLDLGSVLGRASRSTLGLDVRGQVRRVGECVRGFQPGDEVVAIASGGTLRTTVCATAKLVRHYEPGLVLSFLTAAYYGMIHAGRAGPSRTALVHAGAGEIATSAIRMAQAVGCKVFSTTRGPHSDSQRGALKKLGLHGDQIIDADADDTPAAINLATFGKGVDIVFDSTSEHNNMDNFRCVRRCGTVAHCARKSHGTPDVKVPLNAAAVVNIDLAELLEEDADFVAGLLELALEFVRSHPSAKIMSSLPCADFDVEDIEDALSRKKDDPYSAHVSVVGDFNKAANCSAVTSKALKPLHSAINPNGTYLLAGGLGGLGRSIAEMLTSNGARHLAFMSRSGASSEKAEAFVAHLERQNVDVGVYRVDLCDEAALQATVEQITEAMPAIQGLVQCAAVIKDAVFDNMSYADWTEAFRPKTAGSWNLLRAVTAAGHDPFVLFLASSSGVIGNRGQANYAAGNGFEDALARHCRLQGRHAVAIDLGPVLGAGMLADDPKTLDMLKANGFYGIRHADFLKVVRQAITGEIGPGVAMPAQVTLGVGSGGIIRQNEPADPYWSRTALYSYLNLVDMPPPDLAQASPAAEQDARKMLARCSDAAAASDIISAALASVLAKLMNMSPEDMDAAKTPNAYGVDSLVAVGVRNCVYSNFGVWVSVFDILSDMTIAELALMIVEKGRFGGSS